MPLLLHACFTFQQQECMKKVFHDLKEADHICVWIFWPTFLFFQRFCCHTSRPIYEGHGYKSSLRHWSEYKLGWECLSIVAFCLCCRLLSSPNVRLSLTMSRNRTSRNRERNICPSFPLNCILQLTWMILITIIERSSRNVFVLHVLPQIASDKNLVSPATAISSRYLAYHFTGTVMVEHLIQWPTSYYMNRCQSEILCSMSSYNKSTADGEALWRRSIGQHRRYGYERYLKQFPGLPLKEVKKYYLL